ncbi:MAG: hypothetical protein K2H15_00815 [Muribaculaceae bacterium]|nr:hypothetical protein [Muribaculaceae bacterium]
MKLSRRIFSARFPGIALMLLILLSGCSGRKMLYPFRWEATDPQTDSLTLALDRGFYTSADSDSLAVWLHLLEMKAEKNPFLKGRTDFFRAILTEYNEHYEESASLFKALLERTDSAADPYLYNRLRLHMDPDEVSPSQYTHRLDRLEFFRKVDDPFMTGAAAINLGNLLKDVNDIDGALEAYNEGDSMLRRAGFPNLTIPIDINRATALQTRGDSAEALDILHSLLENKFINDNIKYRYMILNNLLISAHDTTVIKEMTILQEEAGNDPESDATLDLALSEIEFDKGNYREALRLARLAYIVSTIEEDDDVRALCLQRMTDAFSGLGNVDSAYYYLVRETNFVDSLERVRMPDEIQAAETGRIIARRKMERELERGKHVLWLALMGCVVFVCVIGVAAVMVWRMQRLRLRHALDTAEREKAHRRLMATQILVDEKNALLNTLSKDLRDLEERGEISAGTKGHITAPIKTHIVQTGHRENFLETFSELHPEFSLRLSEQAPDITDTDLRLAKYIAIGLDSKQIASTLGIRPESVKQARWRLRSKLHLATGDSLESRLKALL